MYNRDMESKSHTREPEMSNLMKCEYCLEVAHCDVENGKSICGDCQFFMRDSENEMSDEQLEAQYQASIDNPLGLEVMDDEQYVAPPESEFDDFDLGSCEDYYDDSMDGDHESAFGSIGWGVDETYDHGSCDDYNF